jgi:hypothetical protein
MALDGNMLLRVAPNVEVVKNGSKVAGINSISVAAALASATLRLLPAQRTSGVRHRVQNSNSVPVQLDVLWSNPHF